MTSERKLNKNFPSILSRLRGMNNHSLSTESREDGPRSRTEPRVTPRLAWVARKESSASVTSIGPAGPGGSNGMDTLTKSASLLSRIPSLMSLGGNNTTWGKRLKKKKDAEEYAAQRLERQRQEMINFYRGTPMTDDRATPNDILRFLYEMWQPQLCSSYRPDVKITTTCRQDQRTARRIAQTTPRRIARLQRTRLVFEACNRTGSSTNLVNDSAPSSGRRSSFSRPISAKSIT